MEAGDKRTIVISGVNLTNGGPLSIFKDCLAYAALHLSSRYRIVALVHGKELFDSPGLTFIEFPQAKKSWLIRLYYEFVHFRKLSRQLAPFLWFSLHDISPAVYAARRAVYCHNPSPFYRLKVREALLEPRFALFNLLYRYLYRINIKANDFVVVQQEWLRQAFQRLYGIANVIVAHPDVPPITAQGPSRRPPRFSFMFPALPRVFKNFEVIAEAAMLLQESGAANVEIRLTINGDETRYSRYIYRKYGRIPSLKFIGVQPRERIFELYRETDCLLFPSKLETWGLPLTEFKIFDKPILAADLPYARETIGRYDKVKFFDPDNPGELARHMGQLIAGRLVYDKTEDPMPAQPFAGNWHELFEILLAPGAQGTPEQRSSRRTM